MMSNNELAKLGHIGKLAEVEVAGFTVTCRVVDIRRVFGRIEVQVAPVSGRGEKWVDLNGKICIHG
jgi:hypothetical protein